MKRRAFLAVALAGPALAAPAPVPGFQRFTFAAARDPLLSPVASEKSGCVELWLVANKAGETALRQHLGAGAKLLPMAVLGGPS